MSSYTILEAETRWSELIARALEGEDVMISRGKAAVELKPIAAVPRKAELEPR